MSPGNRHSLPTSFDQYSSGVVDYHGTATFDDFQTLKGLKQLPFEEGNFSLVLPRLVQSLERSAPPPLALPRSCQWLGQLEGESEVSNQPTAPVSESGSGSPQPDVRVADFASRSTNPVTPILKTPAKSPKRPANLRLVSPNRTSPTLRSSANTPTPPPSPAKPAFQSTDTTKATKAATSTKPSKTSSASKGKEVAKSENTSTSPTSSPTTPNQRRQLSSTFVRGQRLPFAITEEDESSSSESCYSTEEAATSSASHQASASASGSAMSEEHQTQTQSQAAPSPTSTPTATPNSTPTATGVKAKQNPSKLKQQESDSPSPSRSQHLKERMKRMLSAKALRTNVRGQLI